MGCWKLLLPFASKGPLAGTNFQYAMYETVEYDLPSYFGSMARYCSVICFTLSRWVGN